MFGIVLSILLVRAVLQGHRRRILRLDYIGRKAGLELYRSHDHDRCRNETSIYLGPLPYMPHSHISRLAQEAYVRRCSVLFHTCGKDSRPCILLAEYSTEDATSRYLASDLHDNALNAYLCIELDYPHIS